MRERNWVGRVYKGYFFDLLKHIYTIHTFVRNVLFVKLEIILLKSEMMVMRYIYLEGAW